MKKITFLIGISFLLSNFVNAQTVKTVEAFVKAIGSDKTIVLDELDFHLSKLVETSGNTSLQECYDGKELVISNIKNLIIKGRSKKSQLITEPAYGFVLIFKNCENIVIENITAGHGPKRGYCTGGVFAFTNCKNITLKNNVLYGSGTVGVELTNVENFVANKTTIKECTYYIMTATNSKNVTFNKCKFYDNQQFDLIILENCQNFTYKKCSITNNSIGEFGLKINVTNYSLFNLDKDCRNIMLKKCKVKGNKIGYFANYKSRITLKKTSLKGNDFFHKTYQSD